jgi:hypothetical protein
MRNTCSRDTDYDGGWFCAGGRYSVESGTRISTFEGFPF